MSSMTNEDLHEKYTQFTRTEVERVKREYESKVVAVTSKLENNLNTLSTLLETKTLQLEQVVMTRDTMEKTYNYAVIDDVHAREDLIMELKAKNEALQEIFDQTNTELKNWTTKLMTGTLH
jgi:succinate dehydrogenase flavin-adding protein (antitoxin of CptAB toxin-antitoxin module)